MSARHVTSSVALLILVLSMSVLVHLPASLPTQLLSPLPNVVSSARADEFRAPERDRWQMPNKVLAALNLKKGDVVADIGAGTGYFTMRFAELVGPGGKVYAVDIDARVLEYLGKEARKRNLNNVETIVSREDDPLLPGGSLDVAFFCDTVHEIAGRVSFYRKVRRALKNDGRMVVIDSIAPAPKQGGGSTESMGQGLTNEPGRQGGPSNEPEGPVSRDVAVHEAEQAGFRLIKEPKFLPRQYFLVFRSERGPDKNRRR